MSGNTASPGQNERVSVEGDEEGDVEIMDLSHDLGSNPSFVVDDVATAEGNISITADTSAASLGAIAASIAASEQSIQHKTRHPERVEGAASGPGAASTNTDSQRESSSLRVNKVSGEMLEEESAASARRYFLSLTKREMENYIPTHRHGGDENWESSRQDAYFLSLPTEIENYPTQIIHANSQASSRPGAYPVGYQSNTDEADDSQMIPLPAEDSRQHTQEHPVVGNDMPVESNADVNAAVDQLGDLVEANPVANDVLDISRIQTAEAVEQGDSENRQTKNKHTGYVEEQRCGPTIILFALACVVLAVMLSVFHQSSRSSSSGGPTQAPLTTIAPFMSPSQSPSSAPSEFIIPNLPESTLENLNNISTPQWKAFDWLSRHPDLSIMPTWRKTQLFSLAAFYHAFEGPHWREVVQERWMRYDQSECLWFSSEYGSFRDQGRQPIAFSEDRKFNLDPCNDKGEMQTIVLDDLELGGLAASIPPEIGFLTSLAYLALRRNGIKATLEEFLPSEIYQMPNLTVLALNDNKGLSGTLTTELGLLSRLQSLELDDNSHSGLLPSELSMMTQLKKLLVHRNKKLTGQIPSHLGKLTSILFLALNQNLLSGPIPSQLGLLTDMQFLQLAKNSLVGTIPPELGWSIQWADRDNSE